MEFPIVSTLFNKTKLKSLNFANIISKTSFLNNIENSSEPIKNVLTDKTTKNLERVKRPRESDEKEDQIESSCKKKCPEADKIVEPKPNEPSSSKVAFKSKKYDTRISTFFCLFVIFI